MDYQVTIVKLIPLSDEERENYRKNIDRYPGDRFVPNNEEAHRETGVLNVVVNETEFQAIKKAVLSVM